MNYIFVAMFTFIIVGNLLADWVLKRMQSA